MMHCECTSGCTWNRPLWKDEGRKHQSGRMVHSLRKDHPESIGKKEVSTPGLAPTYRFCPDPSETGNSVGMSRTLLFVVIFSVCVSVHIGGGGVLESTYLPTKGEGYLPSSWLRGPAYLPARGRGEPIFQPMEGWYLPWVCTPIQGRYPLSKVGTLCQGRYPLSQPG